MPRRVGLPGASELFRSTAGDEQTPPRGVPDATPAPSGRVKHDEKITVYVSSDELLALEQVRLTLRAQHGVAVDRGRIVRAAISQALEELAAHGADSELVRRLTRP